MRNNRVILLLIILFLAGCNIPVSLPRGSDPQPSEQKFLWDLGRVSSLTNIETQQSLVSDPAPTSTPQLIKPVNFEEAFSHAQSSAPIHPLETLASSAQPELHPEAEAYIQTGGGTDRAEWLYFSPAEYSTEPLETLYAAFRNSGDSVWTEDYRLEFYAGSNPSRDENITLSKSVHPEEQASFQIPVTTGDDSWKACWQLKNTAGEPFYDFCYSHGSGINTQSAQVNSSPASSDSGVFWAFVKTEGSAPARYSDGELSAELVSTVPASGHDFQAYDHYENLTVNFKNNGSVVWDSTYSLVFYSGYNWMHANAFPLSGSTGPGETAVITMPMEIFEDRDRWVSCWYLSTPDGKNLADFCFNYTTS